MNSLTYFGKNLTAVVSVLNKRCLAAYGYALMANILSIIMRRSLAPADTDFMKNRSLLKVQSIGGQILLKQPDFSLVRELYGRNIYFPDHRFIPPAGGKVVDLGANAGLFSILCANLGADVLAVEAQSGFIEIARTNFALNGVENRIHLMHALVGSLTGMFSQKELRRISSHWVDDPPEVSLDTLLYDFLSEHQSMIHLLKIDIEGSEFDLFLNDLDWLDKVMYVSMEVHPEFGDVAVLCNRIEKVGFACKMIPSWREAGTPKRYPGHLFASKIS